MKFLLREDLKSLYEKYLIVGEDEQVEYEIIGKKEIDELLEIQNVGKEILARLKLVNYFGKTNFEVYYNDQLVATIGEEVNLFKDVFYFDLAGWKLKLDKENNIYDITDIEDNEVFVLKKPLVDVREDYEIEICKTEDIVSAIVISIVMYIYDKLDTQP